jgi:hypothetical protein
MPFSSGAIIPDVINFNSYLNMSRSIEAQTSTTNIQVSSLELE